LQLVSKKKFVLLFSLLCNFSILSIYCKEYTNVRMHPNNQLEMMIVVVEWKKDGKAQKILNRLSAKRTAALWTCTSQDQICAGPHGRPQDGFLLRTLNPRWSITQQRRVHGILPSSGEFRSSSIIVGWRSFWGIRRARWSHEAKSYQFSSSGLPKSKKFWKNISRLER